MAKVKSRYQGQRLPRFVAQILPVSLKFRQSATHPRSRGRLSALFGSAHPSDWQPLQAAVRTALRHSDPIQADELIGSLLRSDHSNAILMGLHFVGQRDQNESLRPDDSVDQVRARRRRLDALPGPQDVLCSVIDGCPAEQAPDLACMLAAREQPDRPALLARLISTVPSAAPIAHVRNLPHTLAQGSDAFTHARNGVPPSTP